MKLKHILCCASAALLWCVSLFAQASSDPRALTEQGYGALAENRLQDAARAFQAAIDLNPSSAMAHEGLGVTLSRILSTGDVRPSADSDIAQRAVEHLRRATELAPSAAPPRLALADLEAGLAERSGDPAERADHYREAREMLKQVLALKPGQADLYLRLASMARDEFGPAIQQAAPRAKDAKGPIQDPQVRRALQQSYGELVNGAITNARAAAQLTSNSPRPFLLISRLLRERALIRDTPEQYTADMQSAEDAQRQFLAMGGHLDGTK
jgi:tetratricopeptide (TPR) repeat protein